ncbi:MAG TPA: hypothetical protein VHB70_12560 [Parafilimonas sp.]|nr:hypothetical protein [Parafilimonas sp.]
MPYKLIIIDDALARGFVCSIQKFTGNPTLFKIIHPTHLLFT